MVFFVNNVKSFCSLLCLFVCLFVCCFCFFYCCLVMYVAAGLMYNAEDILFCHSTCSGFTVGVRWIWMNCVMFYVSIVYNIMMCVTSESESFELFNSIDINASNCGMIICMTLCSHNDKCSDCTLLNLYVIHLSVFVDVSILRAWVNCCVDVCSFFSQNDVSCNLKFISVENSCDLLPEFFTYV
jgi:hypothetical protein